VAVRPSARWAPPPPGGLLVTRGGGQDGGGELAAGSRASDGDDGFRFNIEKDLFDSWVLNDVGYVCTCLFLLVLFVCCVDLMVPIQMALFSIAQLIIQPLPQLLWWICGLLFLFPKPTLFRDRVTKAVFAKEFFITYEEAVVATKAISVLVILALCCCVFTAPTG
jgi:hypothetical protein